MRCMFAMRRGMKRVLLLLAAIGCSGLTGCTNRNGTMNALEIYMLDVGEADCFLLRQGDKTMLIDAGEAISADAVVSFIAQLDIDRLDYVLLTHPHADHIGGMARVIEAFEVGTYICCDIPDDVYYATLLHRRTQEMLTKKGIPQQTWEYGLTFLLGKATVEIFPLLGEYDDANEYSAICRVGYGGRYALFTGDTGEPAQSNLLASPYTVRADILKMAHHGGPDAAYEAFWREVKPTIGLISCAEGSVGKHPAKKTMSLADKYDVTLYRTDLHGNVKVTVTTEAIRVQMVR